MKGRPFKVVTALAGRGLIASAVVFRMVLRIYMLGCASEAVVLLASKLHLAAAVKTQTFLRAIEIFSLNHIEPMCELPLLCPGLRFLLPHKNLAPVLNYKQGRGQELFRLVLMRDRELEPVTVKNHIVGSP